MSADDREIIDKIKDYAKTKGKDFGDADFCSMTSAVNKHGNEISDSTLYRKKRNQNSFINFDYLVKIYQDIGDGKPLQHYTYLKDFLKDVLIEEQNAKEINALIQKRKNIMDCLDFISTSSPILFISMYSSQLSESIDNILNVSTHQNSILKELNICVNEIDDNDYENRDVIIQKIRKWRENNDYVGDVFIRMIFREYNVPSTIAGIVDGKVISFVRDGEQLLQLSDIGQKLIVDDVIQIMSPKFSEYLLSSQDGLVYDDVSNVDNPAVKLTDF